jgi:phosphoglycolate phosphatase-like HAD superfamily hydrolase
MSKPVIALDADGVLLDYTLAYAGAWHRAFGERPSLRDPTAYWAIDRWEVERLEDDERLTKFRLAFDDEFWAAIPPIAGAVEACVALSAAGFELVCVSALPEIYRAARQRNLRAHGFPIDVVHATDNVLTTASPKADTLNALAPVAFVDDYLPYFVGVDPSIHRALVLREPNGSPNTGDLLVHIDSQHADLASFARWWLDAKARR